MIERTQATREGEHRARALAMCQSCISAYGFGVADLLDRPEEMDSPRAMFDRYASRCEQGRATSGCTRGRREEEGQ